MNTVEQIRSYVERTKVKDGYSLGLREIQALFYMAKDDPVDALVLAFSLERPSGNAIPGGRGHDSRIPE